MKMKYLMFASIIGLGVIYLSAGIMEHITIRSTIDWRAMLTVCLFGVGGVIFIYNPKDIWNAFTKIRSETEDNNAAYDYFEKILKVFGLYIFIGSLFMCLFSTIDVLSNITKPQIIGPGVASAICSILWAAIIYALVVLPMRAVVEAKKVGDISFSMYQALPLLVFALVSVALFLTCIDPESGLFAVKIIPVSIAVVSGPICILIAIYKHKIRVVQVYNLLFESFLVSGVIAALLCIISLMITLDVKETIGYWFTNSILALMLSLVGATFCHLMMESAANRENNIADIKPTVSRPLIFFVTGSYSFVAVLIASVLYLSY